MGKFGTYERLETLIEAFRDLRSRPGLGALELVIGGAGHPNTQGYMASVAASCAEDPGITIHGYVTEGDIADFFMQARVSVFDNSSTSGC